MATQRVSQPSGAIRINVEDPVLRTENHPPVILSVSNQDSIVWFSPSGSPFKIKIDHDHQHDKKGPRKPPDQPFSNRFPNEHFTDELSSGLPVPEAAGHTWKFTVTFENQKFPDIDPHLIITG
jgi:hypothetical protein